MLRHGLSDFEDCAWQRNLSHHGLDRARLVGENLRALDIPIGPALASPYCRCTTSVTKMLGTEPERHLGLLYPSRRARARNAR